MAINEGNLVVISVHQSMTFWTLLFLLIDSHHRLLDVYEENDEVHVTSEMSDQNVVMVNIFDEPGGKHVGSASFVKDSTYFDTTTLLKINMIEKNKGYGSRLLRYLHKFYWRTSFVRIWNASSAATTFYRRLGFVSRKEEYSKGEKWFKSKNNPAVWPLVTVDKKRIRMLKSKKIWTFRIGVKVISQSVPS